MKSSSNLFLKVVDVIGIQPKLELVEHTVVSFLEKDLFAVLQLDDDVAVMMLLGK